MRKTIVAGLLGAAMLFAPAVASADARPSTDRNSGSAEQSNCQTTKTRDRGYLIEVKQERFGEMVWVKQRAKSLPDPAEVQFRVIKDYGYTNYNVCKYKKN